MSENTLHIDNIAALKNFITEDIYRIPEHTAYESFRYTGENNKYLLILTNERISQTLHEFLMKILSAVQFELRDIAILQTSDYPDVNFRDLKKFFSCTRTIAFGVSPASIGINNEFPLYQPQNIDGVQIVFARSLKEIEADAAHKKQLWNAMQNIFHVKK